MAINAAALDPRIKATVTSTMYDMSRVAREGYFGSTDNEAARDAQRQAWASQRTEDYRTGTYKRAGGVVDPLPDDAPGSSRTITPITRRPAATTSAAATPTTVGMSSARCLS
jgi:hypothetical protein